jgi:hypothetical protein
MHGVYKECDFLLHTFAFCFFGPFLTEEGEKKKSFYFPKQKTILCLQRDFPKIWKTFSIN